jgi:hypothetical protein
MKKPAMTFKIAAALAFLLGSSAVFTGCPFSKDDGAVDAVKQDSAAGEDGFKATVYPFVRTNCVQCHGSVQIPLFASANADTAYGLAYSLVNFAQIPASKFVSKIKDGHCGNACNTDGTNMVNLITTWKAAYGSKANLGGAPVDTGNYFTAQVTIPPNPTGCVPDGDDNTGRTNLLGTPDAGGGTSTDANGNTITVVQSICWMKLKFPLSQVTPALPSSLSRAWLEVDLAYENLSTVLGIASYTFKNPRIVSPDQAIYVHDLKTFMNGNYHPEYGVVYQDIDKTVPTAAFPSPCNALPAFPGAYTPGANCVPTVPSLYSTASSATGILSEGTPDKISFSFEYLQVGSVAPCGDLNMFTTKVYNPIKVGAMLCLNCHKAAGDVTLAGQRFNMDATDATANPGGMADVCKGFLERSIFASPSTSPIIVQPEKGTNGMPAQLNFTADFAPTWICWINRENCLANSGNPAACPATCN